MPSPVARLTLAPERKASPEICEIDEEMDGKFTKLGANKHAGTEQLSDFDEFPDHKSRKVKKMTADSVVVAV
ncbi:hypothetical protein BGZ65_011857 [Modicella reniformis]|uniref:Uncharacterized protein n=1 Tax=Modicella reniformis TaxID=1440133 RepID=A0A9P6SP23_9FUNG|nr:hypothetical protein BGZ65_011857 [Modicella reniformis]